MVSAGIPFATLFTRFSISPASRSVPPGGARSVRCGVDPRAAVVDHTACRAPGPRQHQAPRYPCPVDGERERVGADAELPPPGRADVDVRLALPRCDPRLEVPAARRADQHPAAQQIFTVRAFRRSAALHHARRHSACERSTPPRIHARGDVRIDDAQRRGVAAQPAILRLRGSWPSRVVYLLLARVRGRRLFAMRP